MLRIQHAAKATAIATAILRATMMIRAQQYNGLSISAGAGARGGAAEAPEDRHAHAPERRSSRQDGKVLPRECFPILFCDVPPALAQKPGDTLSYTLEAMDRNNIVLGYLGGNPEQVYKWMAAAPGRFLPAASMGPNTDFAMIRAELKAGKLRAGRNVAPVPGHRAERSEPGPIWQIMDDFDTTNFIHTVGMGGPSPRLKIQAGHPQLIEEVMMTPELRLSLRTPASRSPRKRFR
jgi:hypothetical protein